MTANVGMWDRLVRFIVGIALIVAPLINLMGLGSNATVAYILIAIGAVLVLTSMIRFCPLYRLLGMSTCALK